MEEALQDVNALSNSNHACSTPQQGAGRSVAQAKALGGSTYMGSKHGKMARRDHSMLGSTMKASRAIPTDEPPTCQEAALWRDGQGCDRAPATVVPQQHLKEAVWL